MKHSQTDEKRECHFVQPLGSHRDLYLAAVRGFSAGRDEGAITKLRPDLTGDEACLFIGDAHDPEGFAIFYDADLGRVWLDILYVRPDARRKGVASELLDKLETLCAANGEKYLMFGTAADNAAMRALIEKKRGVQPDSIEYRIDLRDMKSWRCRKCGCTQHQACTTEEGPCAWVTLDLCSACVEREG